MQSIAVLLHSQRMFQSMREIGQGEPSGHGHRFELDALIKISLDKFVYPALDA